ncbi:MULTISPECIES: ATP-binding protein [Paraburkholderia]|uniref:ATP-binding protein n=1 Tax=Paraburkholderia TaxID=1822464 RepID=UPI00036A12E2|nr:MULTISPECIES: ATP-binding protein [Paraburkholderia]MDH6152925.1 energy-coupling factor transporter ATP-binding protein EcfA2 [Paraburkholderia sp. WSM4179]
MKDEQPAAPQASADVTHLHDASRASSDADLAGTILLARAPRTIAETGLDQTFLLELVAKSAFVTGKVSLSQLMQRLKLGASVLDSVVSFGVRERILEIVRRGASDLDVELQLTEGGRQRASEFMNRCRYVGPAPVSLAAYEAALKRQSVRQMHVTYAQVRAAFAGLTVRTSLLDDIGGAVNSGKPVIFFGPPGSGKTSLAERLGRLLPGLVALPYAIVVENEIIQIFDQLVHEPHDAGSPDGLLNAPADARWQICRRPTVLSGGELTLEMLELRYDAASGFYQAPPHVKANGGLYVVDDLGRQRVEPAELLNRWIVPFDRGLDMLTLHTGLRFSLPFDVWVAFSSNIAPADLGDEAFFRRLGCKLYVGPLDVAEYRVVYEQRCRELALASEDDAFDYLVHHLHMTSGRPLLACYPGDLLRIVLANARYQEQAAVADGPSLLRAWNSYFAVTGEHDNPPPPQVVGAQWTAKKIAAG